MGTTEGVKMKHLPSPESSLGCQRTSFCGKQREEARVFELVDIVWDMKDTCRIPISTSICSILPLLLV